MAGAVGEALEYTRDRSLDDVLGDRPIQHLLIQNLIILGEAASQVSPATRAAYPNLPWRLMIDTRNRLVHGYFDINIKIIWDTVRQEFPKLTQELSRILDTTE